MKNKEINNKQYKIKKLKNVVFNLNLYILYFLVLPFMIFIIGMLFDFDVVAAIGFWIMVAIVFIYIALIQFLNRKIEKYEKQNNENGCNKRN